MQALEKTLRNRLERTVMEAREVAEEAARAALGQLGVGHEKPDPHLTVNEKKFRNRLRIHGKQLGDTRDSRSTNPTYGEQETDRLEEEVAYQHWHRMLFARFLAENNLLMYWSDNDDEPIDIPLGACQELIDEGTEKAGSMWELAARFAARMLPQIFRIDSPVFQLDLPPEHQQKLEKLVADLPSEVFTASDSLGWVYQFWQSKKKKDINDSEVKIGARELPAVTQLFTEPYMVSFLLDNSLGAWWAARRLSGSDLKTAASEEELRINASIPGVPLNYLRFEKLDDGTYTLAAGTFDAWPEHLSELKTLDPCCGSGHFLVAAFLMLVPMRMEREGLSARDAVDAVLRENIYGLELDQRCVELAAFALALTAWRYPGAGGYRLLPELNVACSGLSVSVAKEEWKQLALDKHNLRIAMDLMHDTFMEAPILGSLLNPANTDAARLVEWSDLSNALKQAQKQEQTDEQQEAAVVAQGLSKAATLLAGKYHWIITNVPYLARGKQSELLRDFCEEHYSAAKNDLATVFLERCLEFCVDGGTTSIVLPQNWLFLPTYKKFREKLLKNETWHLIARLGPGAFETISGEVVKAILISMSRRNATDQHDGLFGERERSKLIRGMDVSELRTAIEKADGLLEAEIRSIEQAKQLENPGIKVHLDNLDTESILSEYASVHYGSKPGQTARVTRQYWELSRRNGKFWVFMESSPVGKGRISGKTEVCYSLDAISTYNIEAFGVRGSEAWKQAGIIISKMSNLPYSVYLGEFFDDNTCVITPNELDSISAIYCSMEENTFQDSVRLINQKVSVTKETLESTPFDLEHWIKVAEEKYPNGLPIPYSDDPTQWIYHGHPCGSVVWDDKVKWTAHGPLRLDDTVLHVAVARLLGYRWPAELDTDMELAGEQREWVKRSEELLPYADEDGIACIPPVRGEACASDRLLNLLAAAYGNAWTSDTLAKLLKSADHAGKTLETWLRDKFFTQHCKLFKHRPFIWHIWDGLRDGFAALVNYHKLDFKLLETLIYTYLGDWIKRQKDDIESGVDGAQERLDAAVILKKRLKLILEGKAPYDIFVRWKPLHLQPLGWEPDLNDGVRINIRPFLSVPDVGKKGAGVLRDKPNIKWNKDRGKDPERPIQEYPWFWGWDGTVDFAGGSAFTGERFNDCHYTLDMKRKAREDFAENEAW